MPTFRPGKPRVKLGLTANRAQAAGGGVISWDAAVFEDPVIWSAVTPTDYPVPKTGLYIVEINLWRASTTASTRFGCGITVNGARRAASRTLAASNVGGAAAACTLLDELLAGDVVQGELLLSGGSGAVETLQAGETHLSITRIGPERWTG